MQTNVLLVYPEIPTTYWSFKYAIPFIGKKSTMPPLGLITVAALIPENYSLKLVDMNVSELSEQAVKEADIVFVSAMIVQKASLLKVIELCNKCGTPVAAGGPYPTSSHKEIEGVDYFILNEAEVTLPEFIKDYENGTPNKIYTSDIKPDITKTPVPRLDLIHDVKDYVFLALQYSRGCPFNCEFCDIIEMFGRVQRTKKPEQFINEMEAVYNIGFRGSLFIVDDNFIGNKAKVKALLMAIIKWQKEKNYPFRLFTEASINLAQDDELLDSMVEAGFENVFVGIETPDVNTLALTQKTQNLREDIFENIKKIQTHGMEVYGGFIVGFDSDPSDIFERQIDFIQKAGIPVAMIGLLTALPNTQLYRRLLAEGRLTGASKGNNTHDFEINYIPKMPKKKLMEGYKRIISEIYSPKNYFERCLTLLYRLPSKKIINDKVTWIDFKALILSVLKQGFSSYGLIYFKYLLKILFKKSSLFPLAVNYAVKGYHFFRITEEIVKAEEFSSMLETHLEGLKAEIADIMHKGNTLIASKMEKYKIGLQYKTGKKYRQMSRDMQVYLTERLDKFENYCDLVTAQWKEKLHLSNKSED
ncbi:MAG: B12-binding domain-containing radical SAM protein [Spirochaetes bacterium]|nr:B12-binding domain-containing radical SAM protein [Spirochaetota bacterium]